MANITARFAAFDADLIWGVGATPAAAIADADSNRDNTRTEDAPAYRTAEMTPALAAEVQARGGNVAFNTLRDGRVGTWAEWDAEG